METELVARRRAGGRLAKLTIRPRRPIPPRASWVLPAAASSRKETTSARRSRRDGAHRGARIPLSAGCSRGHTVTGTAPRQPAAVVNAILGTSSDASARSYELLPGQVRHRRGAKGGEYFTPTSIVRLIVEIIEPLRAKILDPACGSGGMFVQSAGSSMSIATANDGGSLSTGRSVLKETKLCKMNLARPRSEGQVSQSTLSRSSQLGSLLRDQSAIQCKQGR